MGKGSAGLNKGAGIGIRPGGGKKANEFDELDAEDARIAAANEAKAQAGIPPGGDHPLVVSHKNKAVSRSRLKAKLDTMSEEAKEEYLAKMARGEIETDEDSREEEQKDELGRPKEIPPWVHIPVDPKEVAWFRRHYRLKVSPDSDPSDLAQLRPLDDRNLRKAEIDKIEATERAARYSARSKADKREAAEKAAADKEEAKERIMVNVATFELQAVHYSRSDFREMPELARRLAIEQYFKDYTKGMEGPKKRAPRGHVVTENLPLLVRLSKKDMHTLQEEERLARIMTHHGQFSKPFQGLRNYFLFLAAFLTFLYCGRSGDPYWVRTGLLNEIDSTTFESLSTTSALFDYLRDDFLPAMFPQQGPSGAELTCKQKQFLGDGVNVRVGNMRIRQIRVGLNGPTHRWTPKDVHKYSTCQVPSMFKDAYGENRCFRAWGYKPDGVGSINQYTRNYRLQSWQDEAELDAPSRYSVGTRMRFPGEGYVKMLGNRLDYATEDLDALEKHTWIDVQTRAVFLEYTLLNVPTSLIVTGTLSVQYGAEGNVTPGADASVSRLYKYYRIMQLAADGFGSGTTLLAGFALGLACAAFAWHLSRHVMAIPSLSTCVAFTCTFGACGGWWGCSMAFAASRNEYTTPYLFPAAEIFMYGLVLYQMVVEARNIYNASERGDTAWGYVFGDLFSALNMLNLAFFFAALVYRIAALSEIYAVAEDMEEALTRPCHADAVAASFAAGESTYTSDEAAAWAAVPEGCWGTVVGAGGQAPAASGPDKFLGTYSEGQVDYGQCAGYPSATDLRVANSCCAEGGYVNLDWAMDYDQWVDFLNAFNALFLILRFFKFVRMFRSLSLFAETLKESGKRLGHIAFIIALIMTGFAMAFHLAFGFQEDKFRDFFESIKTLYEMLLGNNDLGSLRLINPYLAPVFFYGYILVMVMVVLSMFVAVVNSSYEDSRELLAEADYCFVRDTLWRFTVDADTLLPVYNDAEIFEALNLSKAFRQDASVYTLGDSDKLKLTQALEILANNCEGTNGEPPLLMVPLHRPDGKTAEGSPTRLLVKNTDYLRDALRYARGVDASDLVDDFVHLYWSFLQIGPLKWFLSHSVGPGARLNSVVATPKEFKLWFEGEHEELDEKDPEADYEEGLEGDEEQGEEGAAAMVVKKAPKRDTAADDAILRKLGLNPEQIEYLHKVEEPKLSLMRELTGLEQGQRRLLAAIDLLTKRSKDLEEAHGQLVEHRSAASASEAKRKREEEAEAKADEARKELLNKDAAAAAAAEEEEAD